ncbi:MAG: ATP-binding protein [Syntrophales bacterium]|nr:ATP-binding protein [Syntrophales bacterium]
MIKVRPHIDARETRRRKRERLIIIATIAVIIALSLLEGYLYRKESVLPLSSNVLIFGLINVNIILVIFLLFLIIRNVVKLVFERRRGVIGSKLRTKLVAAFVGLSLVPTAILFIVAINFLSYSIDNWFNLKIGEALKQTIEIAQVYYQQTADHAKYYARQISEDITKNRLYVEGRSEYLRTLIEQRQKNYKLGLLGVYFDNKKETLAMSDPLHPRLALKPFAPKILEEVYGGKESSTVQQSEGGDLISGLAPIYSYLMPKEVIGVVAVSYYIPKGLVDKMAAVSKTSEQYRQLDLLKNPIKLSYIITLFIVMLLIIFSATWFGIFLANGITVPIQDLAEATRRIARGDLEHQINVVANDEIGVLVDSFNQMTRDLQKSNGELKQANISLEERRKYTETVLGHVSAGVISVDKDGVIATINSAAEKMFDIKTEKVINRRYGDVLIPEHLALVDEIVKEIRSNHKDFIEQPIELTLKDRALSILMTTTVIKDDEGEETGMVVVFEDLTELQKAVRATAWREVAKRMAHEIKNPLTPVQLSAQRLQKKYGDKLGEDGAVFEECTRTIIKQVEVLKNMVNEFSHYARLPVVNPALNNLNEVIGESITLFQEGRKDIHFNFQGGEDIPKLNFDGEQIKRVMVNLLDNAVAAVVGREGVIEITTSFDGRTRKAKVEVADNGCGIPAGYKMKMFEPYFSTKKSGTGLGLAIVSSIISDHSGHISVRDNPAGGTIVAFELSGMPREGLSGEANLL